MDVPAWGEIGVTLRLLSDRLGEELDTVDQREEITERWVIWRAEKAGRLADDRGKGISSSVAFDAMNRVIPRDAIIAVDVGNNTYSFGRYFECIGQTVLISGYLGSIGFSLPPPAMDAWAVTQEDDPSFENHPVVSVSGDGGFGQYMAEFNTAVKYGINITHILLNNAALRKISKEQKAENWDVWQTSLHNPASPPIPRTVADLESE